MQRANTERGTGKDRQGEEGHAGHLNAKAEGSNIIIALSLWCQCLFNQSLTPREHVTPSLFPT